MNSFNILLAKILHSLAPVEHRRELDHHALGFRQQLIDDLKHIWCTVGDAIGSSPVLIATGRIDKYQIGRRHRVQIVLAITIHHLDLMKPQKLEISR